jgi:hypothetical protein
MNEEAKKPEEAQESPVDTEREALLTRLLTAADKFSRKQQVKYTKKITGLVAILGKHQSAHLAVINQTEKSETDVAKKTYEKDMRTLSETYQRDTDSLKRKFDAKRAELNEKFKGQYVEHEKALKEHQTSLSNELAAFHEQVQDLTKEQLEELLRTGQIVLHDDPKNHKLIRTPEKLQEVRQADAKRETENAGTPAPQEGAEPAGAGEPGDVEEGVSAQE